jgi:hypothetical protein
MRIIILLAFFTILFSACQNQEKPIEEEKWQSLFNGKDLTGWTPKIAGYKAGDNYGNTFRVENGILKVSYAEYDTFQTRFGHLFYEKPFSNYRLRVEYRFVGEQMKGVGDWAFKNSGVMFHSQSAASMNLDQEFPVSLEAQFLGGSDGLNNRPTGNLCTPGLHVIMGDTLTTEHCITSAAPTFNGDEWITFEIIVKGDEIMHHVVNGKTVITYKKPTVGGDFLPENYTLPEGTPVKSGYIALQSESHPIEFRKVEILEIK